MNHKQKAVIEWCIQSLTNEPDVWTCDSYQCEHPNGTTVWIANEYYGMAVYVNPQRAGGRIGGVEAAGSMFGWLVPWRRRLRYAALRALRGQSLVVEDVILSRIVKA